MRPLLQLFWLDLGISSMITLLNILIPYLAKDYFKLFAIILFPYYFALIFCISFGTLIGLFLISFFIIKS